MRKAFLIDSCRFVDCRIDSPGQLQQRARPYPQIGSRTQCPRASSSATLTTSSPRPSVVQGRALPNYSEGYMTSGPSGR